MEHILIDITKDDFPNYKFKKCSRCKREFAKHKLNDDNFTSLNITFDTLNKYNNDPRIFDMSCDEIMLFDVIC